MAYTTGASFAATAAAIISATPAAQADAVNNALSGLATATPPNPAIGTPVLIWNVLVKCTTGWGVPPGTAPVFSYDASPA
jgi:hypothetical protein